MTTTAKFNWRPVITCTLLIFVVSIDTVMMPIATTAISSELSTDAGMIQFVIAMASLIAAPLYITSGKLGDIYGRKKIFSIGLILYGVGLVIAAIAPNVLILIGGWSTVRVLGQVLALSASVVLLSASYPDDSQRAQAFAIYGVGGVAASLIGPLLMGFMANNVSWRVPFGLATLIVLGTLGCLGDRKIFFLLDGAVPFVVPGFCSRPSTLTARNRPWPWLPSLLAPSSPVWLQARSSDGCSRARCYSFLP